MKDHKQTHSATDLLIVCTCVNNRVIVVWVCCKGAAIDCTHKVKQSSAVGIDGQQLVQPLISKGISWLD